MRSGRFPGGGVVALIVALGLLAAGCANEEGKGDGAKSKSPQGAGKGKAHDHSGWWCEEHGVPEKVCGQCDPKVAAEFQKNGDWCSEHDRPKSQCFKCDPKLKERFAAEYRAKYGKEPPPLKEEN
jgi:hypothetical protein